MLKHGHVVTLDEGVTPNVIDQYILINLHVSERYFFTCMKRVPF